MSFRSEITSSDLDILQELHEEKKAQLREAQDSALGFSQHAARLQAQIDSLARVVRYVAVVISEAS